MAKSTRRRTMEHTGDSREKTGDLRNARELVRQTTAPPPAVNGKDIQRLLHELQVHEIELELQNEELRNAMAALEEARNQYRSLFDLSPTGYVILTREGLVREINLTGCSLLGQERMYLRNIPFAAFVSRECLDDFHSHLENVYTGKTGRKHTCELWLRTKDRERIACVMESALVGNKENDTSTCYSAIVNITERKLAEEEKARLQNQILQSQKMESVGRLAGGVAHDFNNMMGIILGHLEMVMDQIEPDGLLYLDLMQIRRAADRCAALTQQLLAFARKQPVRPRVVDLNKCVANVFKMLTHLIGEDIKIDWRPGSDLWPVRIDPTQIEQVLFNLSLNARDAIVGTGSITIESGMKIFHESSPVRENYYEKGEFIVLTVSDDGCGMARGNLEHIFEPFYTTKEVGKGTGMGLASVHGVVKQNNGFIHAYSEKGYGTTIKIYLPRHVGALEPQIEIPDKEVKKGHETVLLVEDQKDLLRTVERMLQSLGYKVLAANSPGEAIRLEEQNINSIQLLMTDVVMPGINGYDLYRHIRTLNPNVKCLFSSGYPEDVIARRGMVVAGMHFLPKPFSRHDLSAKVRESLDSP